MEEQLIYIIMVIAIALSALCSMLEATLLSTPLSYVTGLEEQGVKGAARLKKLKQNPDRPISAILCLNTIANTVGASIVGSLVYEVYGDVLVGAFSTIFTLAILIFSEIIPKTIGSYYWRQLAMPSATIIRGMIIISYPLVWLSEWITKLVASKKQPLSVSREEVSAMVSVGTQEGVFDNSESQMIQSLFKLSSKTLYEIMTPRTVAITASANMKLKEFYDNQMHRIYSRIPVYDENPNFITGFVLKQTVLEELAEDKFNKQLKDIRRPILSYNEDKLVSEVWEEMLLKKEHIAQVQDEYGCFLGIVTMEDIIETIIGREIVDESDTIVDMQAYAREKWQRELKHKNKL